MTSFHTTNCATVLQLSSPCPRPPPTMTLSPPCPWSPTTIMLLQQLLDMHCHLTNQPYLPADHNPLVIPLLSDGTAQVEPKRYNRSKTGYFYILDSPSRCLQLPTLFFWLAIPAICIHFHFPYQAYAMLQRGCPDTTSFCKKNVPFLLTLYLYPGGWQSQKLCSNCALLEHGIHNCLKPSAPFLYVLKKWEGQQLPGQLFYVVDLSKHMVDATTNWFVTRLQHQPTLHCLPKNMHIANVMCCMQ